MKMIESGNVAAANGVKLARAQVIAAYPITPQTPLTEKLSEMIESGDMEAEYVVVESEHSALGVCIGATSAGARAFTGTSANGLLYMSEQVHWAAGARLPMVMCVVNRGVGAPWTIWNDHQDSISQRDSGWIQIYVNDHQEILDTVIKAFRLAEAVSIPVMVCYDGYYLSHTYMPFEVPEEDQVDRFLPPYHYKHTLDPAHPENLNTVTMSFTRPDAEGVVRPAYMDIRHNLHQELRQSISVFEEIDREFEQIFGRGGNSVVTEYRCDDADYIAVAMGSVANRIKDVVDELRDEGLKIGVLCVHLYRPFPDQAINAVLGKAKGVIVFEKAISYGNQGALFGDVKAALYSGEKRPFIRNYILGLGGRDIKTGDLYDALKESCAASATVDDAPHWIGLNR
ncbi:MAG: pyruvate ferredoxin oxidoreductase [Proteobacteria bacterium]|nr:pyruvate ferredoxin oxidoreductase [Pseudomonadota bacterium]